MADFYQHGVVTTLHQLRGRSVESLEAELMGFRASRPMGLILPSLYSELEGPALSHIVDEICQVPYLEQVVVGLDRADADQYREALQFFGRLPQRAEVLWNDGPRLLEIQELLRAHGLGPAEPGKGRNVWSMFGYVLATGRVQAVALHDCDILTYDRGLLARLIYPVANPRFGYRFCKGYYARVAENKMNGRVCRLLVSPLVRAMAQVCGDNEFLRYLDAFRYPLAGEFALTREVIEDVRIPADWGLEMGILSEVYRNYATGQICQVDIADTYDHKHQELSAEDRSAGLSRMSTDISLALFRKMATQGQVFSKSRIRTIKATYYRMALDLIDAYHDDAMINGMRYDRHREVQAVEVFAENVLRAGEAFLDQPMTPPFMPSWRRVQSAIPDIFERIADAVEADRAQYGGRVAGGVIPHPQAERLRQRVVLHLGEVYGADRAEDLADQVLEEAGLQGHAPVRTRHRERWDERTAFAITYGDTLIRDGEPPLRTLHRFLQAELREVLSGVHVLPFFPSSSDDGFSVIDYDAVDPALGSWRDIERLAGEYLLMADVVINHCSRSSAWFQNFLADRTPGKGWFIEVDEDADLSQVVRPRSSPLTVEVQAHDGPRRVWCTFSEDQVDLNFANPEVLLRFVRLLRDQVARGVRFFRLDAVAYLWKEPGTPCIHLPQTHEIIKLLRLVLDELHHEAVIVTETNVPLQENLSYFGNGNEAHLIYNFSLPPLLIHALHTGSCRHLTAWGMSMPPARRGRAYLNFIASHDGIGVRPAEGFLSGDELDAFAEGMKRAGGRVSTRRGSDGEDHPYEINISLYDALSRTEAGEDGFTLARFLCAHTIMLGLEGVPFLYLHSLLGTTNDHDLVAETGVARSINRHRWTEEELAGALADPGRHHRAVLDGLKRLLQIRTAQPAFHPNATQYTLNFGTSVFAFWRESLDRSQSIFALHNVTSEPQEVALVELNLIGTEVWRDLLSDARYEGVEGSVTLPPYGCAWITNR